MDSCSNVVTDKKYQNSYRINHFLYVFVFVTKLNYQYNVVTKVWSLQKPPLWIVLSMFFNFAKFKACDLIKVFLSKKHCSHIFSYFYTRLLPILLSSKIILLKTVSCTIADCFSIKGEIPKFCITIIYGFAAVHFQRLLFLFVN